MARDRGDDAVTPIDLAARFDYLKRSLPAVMQDLLSVKGKVRELRPRRVWVGEAGDGGDVDKGKLKTLKLQRGTLKLPVYADIDVVDVGTGKVVSSEKKVRVADLPRPTPHQSLLVNGVEYHPHAQMRLKPGVYVRKRENGEVVGQFNYAKTREVSKGLQVTMNPEDGVFYARIGSTNVGLLPMLDALGVPRSKVEQSWGTELLRANAQKFSKTPDVELAKVHRAIRGTAPKSAAAASEAARKFLDAIELDGETTKATLGSSHEKASSDTLLSASRKMIQVNRGKEEADNREDLRFKSLVTYDEHVVESLRKAKRSIQSKLRRRSDAKLSARDIIIRHDLNRPIESQMIGVTGLSSAAEQLNPVSILAENARIVATGEGGIRDMNAITEDARSVHPSQLGFIDTIPTPQSKAAGVSLNAALSAKKKGRDFATEVIDLKTGQVTHLTPAELSDTTFALPDQFTRDGGKWRPVSRKIKARRAGNIIEVPASQVRYALSSPKGLFSVGTLLIPFGDSAQGNRALMASNQAEQSLPLVDPDAPVVQSRLVGDKTVEQVVGGLFSSAAPIAGTVSRVEKGRICIRPDGGGAQQCVSLYDNYPLNNGFIDSRPVVKVGDKVSKGQLIADTNHTKGGVLAPGKNLRTGYMVLKGLGFEDAVVISDEAAKKLTSEHVRKVSAPLDDNSVTGKKKYVAQFPNAVNRDQAAKLDDDGVVRKGMVLKKGDVVIAHGRREEAAPEDIRLGRVYKKLLHPVRDRSERWNLDVDGEVIDVVKRTDGIQVNVKTREPTKVGDKLVGRHGNKGVVSAVIPSSQMPQADSGPLEVIFNPLSVPGRLNPSQALETAAGSAAMKSGKVVVTDPYERHPIDNVAFVDKKLKDANAGDGYEDVKDPDTGKSIGRIAVGTQHVLKLEHQADSKFAARGRTGAYDVNMQPARGGKKGSSALAHMEMNGLLAYGADALLREAVTQKGEQNDDFWRAVMLGQPLPPAKTPFVFEKLLAWMKGAGVNVERQGNTMRAMPMTDDQVLKMSSGEVKKPEFLMAGSLKEIEGGLFDEKVTGGISGTKWSHVRLAEPVVNPATKKAARIVLGMTEKKLTAIAEGREEVQVGSKRMTGGDAVRSLLSKVDVESEIAKAKEAAKTARGARLDEAHKRLRYLRALKKTGLKPQDAYTLKNVPVLPPQFRPIYALPDNELRISGANLLTADVVLINEGLRDLKSVTGIPEGVKQKSREQLQQSVDALFGFGEPLKETKNRAGNTINLKGIAAEIAGDNPKSGFFQRKVWRKQQNLSGKAVAVPNPELGMDEIELPEEMAWTLYEVFIVKELVSLGTPAVQAMKEVEQRTPRAKAALERVMNDRPVTFTRAPALHKFSVLAAKPRITKDKVIKTPPLIVTGLNLDHDGDVLAVHVPVSREAVKDAHKMLPSNNLIHPSTGSPIMVPTMEGILGLSLLTKEKGSCSDEYPTPAKAISAYRAGNLHPGCVIKVGGRSTTAGRELAKQTLGKWYDGGELDKKAITELAKKISDESPKEYADIFRGLLDISHEASYRTGFTVGLNDLRIPRQGRDLFFADAARKAGGPNASPHRIVQAHESGIKSFERGLVSTLKKKAPDNAFLRMFESGAKGGPSQLRQMLYAPVLVQDNEGKTVPVPIKRSYAEGLPLSDYLATAPGVRKGVIDKALQVEIPGVFAKRSIAATMSMVVTEPDCGTTNGVRRPTGDPENLGRYLATATGGVPRNTLITPSVAKRLKKAGISHVEARSVMRCEAAQGVCQRCYGTTETGQSAELGANIGVENAQYASEPTTQATLRTFHTGGAVGSGFSLSTGFPAIHALATMPSNMSEKATLAKTDGLVEFVKSAPAGGWNVAVGGKKHYVPPTSAPIVSKGSKVKIGDPISHGVSHPREMAELVGAEGAQERMVEEFAQNYEAMGRPMRKRVFEVLVRGLTNHATVLDSADHPEWAPGDIVPLSHVTKYNRDAQKSGGPVNVKPTFKGMTQAALVQDDWLARLGATRLKPALEEAASVASESKIKGGHPLPAIVFGKHFGEKVAKSIMEAGDRWR